ncbi:MAG: MMPL family transporter [Thermoanaerobaculia bacterium]
MAVDGNLLIYERLREELARGLKLVQACKAAFERAGVAIIDSNLTTLISGVILQYVGTGPIRGFAVTLNIGILSTLFTVIVVTEALVLLDIKRGTTKLTMAPMFAVPKIRFMANYKKFLYASWALALLGFVLLVALPREKVWGIDFQGGFTMKVRTAEPMQVEALRERVSKIAGAIGESEVKEISDSAVGDRGFTVFSITYKRADTRIDASGQSSGETGHQEQQVQHEADDREHAQLPVEEEHEEDDQPERGERAEDAGVDVILSEARADARAVEQRRFHAQ